MKSYARRFRRIQVFVKVDGSKVFPLEVSLSDKLGDVVKRIPSSACGSKRHVHIAREGRVIRRSDDLNCGISDGSAVQVMSRMRGGGKHKVKTSKAAQERDRSAEKVGTRRLARRVRQKKSPRRRDQWRGWRKEARWRGRWRYKRWKLKKGGRAAQVRGVGDGVSGVGGGVEAGREG